MQRVPCGIYRIFVNFVSLGNLWKLCKFYDLCGLFVHRNTLVYRLEKIKKLTGLDLRKFDDAIVFKVALMVKKYLSSDPARY